MDSLASSHTVDFRTSRLLLVTFFILVHCSDSILLGGCCDLADSDTSSSRTIEDVDPGSLVNFPADDSLGQLQIRNAQSGVKRFRQRLGSAPVPAPILQLPRPPAVGTTQCSNRLALLAEISPSKLRPTTDGQDAAPAAQVQFGRRPLPTGGISPSPPLAPPLEPWFVTESNQDGEDAFLRNALVVDISYPVVRWSFVVDKLGQVGIVLKGVWVATYKCFLSKSLSNSKVSTLIAEDSILQLSKASEHGEEQLGTILERRPLDAGIPPTGHELLARSDHGDDADRLQQLDHSEELEFPHRNLLQADISPPGMWPDADDEVVSQFAGPLLLGRRRLLTLGAISRLGLWQVSDDADSYQRRVLLADISPPGMWPDADHDHLDQFLVEFPDN